MFSFVVKRLGFLKDIPFLAIYYDHLLKLWTYLTKAELLDWIDEIEQAMLQLPNCNVSTHRFGGIQFNYLDKEFAHLHSNGLLDVLFNQQLKAELLRGGKISNHHVFQNSGWISFYLKEETDLHYAIQLLEKAYARKIDLD